MMHFYVAMNGVKSGVFRTVAGGAEDEGVGWGGL